jgi:hypothetical protein
VKLGVKAPDITWNRLRKWWEEPPLVEGMSRRRWGSMSAFAEHDSVRRDLDVAHGHDVVDDLARAEGADVVELRAEGEQKQPS